MMLRFVNARNDKKKLNEIKKLYDEAFPKEEQIPFWILRKASRTSTADLMQVYDDDLLVGFIHLVYFEDVVYLYYFAIEPDERGQGYGSKILQALRRRFSARRIILNIEVVDENCDNYEERKKRKSLSENGFREAGYSTREYGVEYEMLYLGGNVSYEEFLALIRKYFGRTLALMVKKNLKKRKEKGIDKGGQNPSLSSVHLFSCQVCGKRSNGLFQLLESRDDAKSDVYFPAFQ